MIFTANESRVSQLQRTQQQDPPGHSRASAQGVSRGGALEPGVSPAAGGTDNSPTHPASAFLEG